RIAHGHASRAINDISKRTRMFACAEELGSRADTASHAAARATTRAAATAGSRARQDADATRLGPGQGALGGVGRHRVWEDLRDKRIGRGIAPLAAGRRAARGAPHFAHPPPPPPPRPPPPPPPPPPP